MRALLLVFASSLFGCPNYQPPVPYNPATVSYPPAVPKEYWVYLPHLTATRSADKWGTPRPIKNAEEDMIEGGFALANAMLLSPCFRAGVENAEMTHTNDLNAQQIYDVMTKTPPVAIDIDLYDGGPKHGTVGYDNSDDPYTVHMNTYFVTNEYVFASNLLHEAAHARGFIHRSPDEQRSVPYEMNYIFDICGEKNRVSPPSAAPPTPNRSALR